ncbi:hypothetical protein HELRODRAFT_169503 [Helobdella robusta]|uniref:Uncharacterized protein n=1 Tax=Helobdella robusta TaxID=6412 RepID=T1F208_HELRO|nr:hypothetical protein HELRODRAFT_169503 [Helobdella robusta]ESO08623.1 hypothetical protein HELRODRAFT_169503 [Helobdella robusta]
MCTHQNINHMKRLQVSPRTFIENLLYGCGVNGKESAVDDWHGDDDARLRKYGCNIGRTYLVGVSSKRGSFTGMFKRDSATCLQGDGCWVVIYGAAMFFSLSPNNSSNRMRRMRMDTMFQRDAPHSSRDQLIPRSEMHQKTFVE